MHHKTHKSNFSDLPSWYIFKGKYIKPNKNFENELNHRDSFGKQERFYKDFSIVG